MSDEPGVDGGTVALDVDDWRGLVAAAVEVYQRRFIEPRTVLHESILEMRRRLDVLIPRGAWGEYVAIPQPVRPCFAMTPEAREVAKEFSPAPVEGGVGLFYVSDNELEESHVVPGTAEEMRAGAAREALCGTSVLVDGYSSADGRAEIGGAFCGGCLARVMRKLADFERAVAGRAK